ncbi:MAG: polysaccharide lyase [Cystobacter sp.]
MKRLQTIAALAMLVPTLASASVVWKGDLETGNLSQWDAEQSVSSNRLMVVTSPVREGRYALKTTVRQGDNPIKASGNRNELVYLSHETPGSEYFYKWSTLFPSSFPASPKWALFTQWHQEGHSGSPPLEFYVVDDTLTLRVGGSSGKIVWRAPLVREHWNDFVLHVKWSSNKKDGFIELFHDGKLVMPRQYMATQFTSQRNYLKLGLYRDASIKPEGVVYHDGFVQSTRLEDVMPPEVAQAPVALPDATPSPDDTDSPVASDPTNGPPDEQDDGALTQGPTNGAPGTSGLVPGYSDGEMQPASCGASSTGGMPLLVAGMVTALALASRRRKPAHAPATRSTRR